MKRATNLILSSSVMILAAACATAEPDLLEPGSAGAPVEAGAPAVDDAPGEPPASGRTLSLDEQEALADIIAGLPMGEDLELGTLDEVGTVTLRFASGPVAMTTGPSAANVSVMDGIAIQSVQSFETTLVFAFDGLNAQAQTVDELIVLFAPIADPGTVTVSDAPDLSETFAVYIDEVNDMAYFGESGDFTIDAITTDPTTEIDPCAGFGFSCPTVEGTFEGTLDMSAVGYSGVTVISNTGSPGTGGTPLDVMADIDVPLSRTTFPTSP